MDYFDDLDLDAQDAFGELHDGFSLSGSPRAKTLSLGLLALLGPVKHNISEPVPAPRHRYSNMDFLFKIDTRITSTVIARAAILSKQPQIIDGEVFAPINKAHKNLSAFSAYPTLGLDTTLPQHRPQSTASPEFLPAQGQYPVWYFFYGTLADPAFLAQLFGLPTGHVPVLVSASIVGGKIMTWGGKYRDLVDCQRVKVDEWACEVMSEEQEDALRMYETAKYEVVRVEIRLEEDAEEEKTVKGCTFRFAGDEGELT